MMRFVDEMQRLVKELRNRGVNLLDDPAIDLGHETPIIRNRNSRREFALVRSRVPSSSKALFDSANNRADAKQDGLAQAA